MSRKRPARTGNPDLRQQKHVPAPPIEEIEKKIFSLLSPVSFKPLRLDENEEKKKFRDRILSLPVMMAILVSLVYRQIPGLREVQRVLWEEGLLWVGGIEVSAQAVSKRLRTLPIELFTQIFQQVMERINNVQPQNQAVPVNWQPVYQRFTAIWIADGSTLEALRRKLKTLKQQEKTLAGKIMMVVEAFTHQPVTTVLWGTTWYYYLTNVLDPQLLSAHLVCELYRRRWRVEDAFLLTKRLLGLAYIWVGDTNGVQIQILATWIFYAVLNQLSIDVA